MLTQRRSWKAGLNCYFFWRFLDQTAVQGTCEGEEKDGKGAGANEIQYHATRLFTKQHPRCRSLGPRSPFQACASLLFSQAPGAGWCRFPLFRVPNGTSFRGSHQAVLATLTNTLESTSQRPGHSEAQRDMDGDEVFFEGKASHFFSERNITFEKSAESTDTLDDPTWFL